MSPKPDGSLFEWEKKLATVKPNEIDDLESEAKQEIGEFCKEIKPIKERGKKQQELSNQLRDALNKKRAERSPQEEANPVMAAPPPPPQAQNAPPPPPPPGAGGLPPPPPPPRNKGEPPKPSAQALKAQEEKRKREERKQALQNAKQNGVALAQKNEGKDLIEIKKKADSDLKEIQQQIRTLKSTTAYEGGPTLEKLAREREDAISNIDTEITAKRQQVEQYTKQLARIEKNPVLQKRKVRVEGLLRNVKGELTTLIAQKDQKLARIHEALDMYDKQIEVLENKLELQKAYIQGLSDGSKAKNEAKAKANKSPEAILNDAFANRDREFASLEHYNDVEVDIIRGLLDDLNPNLPDDDNPFSWDEHTLEQKFQAAIKLQKIKYTDLKQALGRPLFEDEINPNKVAPPPKSTSVAGIDDAPSYAIGSTSISMGSPSSNPAATKPTYEPPTAPQKKISDVQAALVVIKNSLKSTNIQQRYDKAGKGKSFVSMYLKSQDKSRPKQISMLQDAIQKACTELESLLILRKNLEKSSAPMSRTDIEKHVTNSLFALEETIQKVAKQIDDSQHKRGTSKMVNVLSSLTKELDLMKKAMGIETPKPSASSRM